MFFPSYVGLRTIYIKVGAVTLSEKLVWVLATILKVVEHYYILSVEVTDTATLLGLWYRSKGPDR